MLRRHYQAVALGQTAPAAHHMQSLSLMPAHLPLTRQGASRPRCACQRVVTRPRCMHLGCAWGGPGIPLLHHTHLIHHGRRATLSQGWHLGMAHESDEQGQPRRAALKVIRPASHLKLATAVMTHCVCHSRRRLNSILLPQGSRCKA